MKGAQWNFAKYIFAKLKYSSKQIINSISTDYKLSNDIGFALILRVLNFFELKKLAYKLIISRLIKT